MENLGNQLQGMNIKDHDGTAEWRTILIEFGVDNHIHDALGLPGSPIEQGATPADSATLFKQWAYQQVNFVEWDDMYLSLTNFPNRTATLKVSLPTDETAAYWQSLLDDQFYLCHDWTYGAEGLVAHRISCGLYYTMGYEVPNGFYKIQKNQGPFWRL